MTTIHVSQLDVAIAAVGLDLESFARSARLSSHEAATLAAGGSLRASESSARRVAEALGLPVSAVTLEGGGAGETSREPRASAPSRGDDGADDGRSPFDHVLDRVCADDGYTDEERQVVTETLGAGSFPTHLTRSELPGFARVWLSAAKALRLAGELSHPSLAAKVRAEGPRAAARMAEGIELRIAEHARKGAKVA
ncbi:MAG: hypothetical protein R3A48_23550 [Polyangiales bacterium]